MLRVFLDHEEVASYPETHEHRPDENGDLVILKDGSEVKRHPAGTWHGAGTGIICAGSGAPNPDCPRCNPK